MRMGINRLRARRQARSVSSDSIPTVPKPSRNSASDVHGQRLTTTQSRRLRSTSEASHGCEEKGPTHTRSVHDVCILIRLQPRVSRARLPTSEFVHPQQFPHQSARQIALMALKTATTSKSVQADRALAPHRLAQTLDRVKTHLPASSSPRCFTDLTLQPSRERRRRGCSSRQRSSWSEEHIQPWIANRSTQSTYIAW